MAEEGKGGGAMTEGDATASVQPSFSSLSSGSSVIGRGWHSRSPNQTSLDDARAKLDALLVPPPASGQPGHGGPSVRERPAASCASCELLRTQQRSQLAIVKQALAERDQLKREMQGRKEGLERFQQELVVAVDRLSAERAKWLSDLDLKTSQLEEARESVRRSKNLLEDEKSRCQELSTANRELQHRTALAEQHLAARTTELNECKVKMDNRDKINAAEVEQMQSQLDEMRKSRKNQEDAAAQEAAERKADIRNLEALKSRLEMELAAAKHERDGLKTEASLAQARHEAERAGILSKARAEAERDAVTKAAANHERASAEISSLRESHRAQIAQMTERHRNELNEIRSARDTDNKKHSVELIAEREQHQREKDDLVWKLNEAQSKLVSLQSSIKQHSNFNPEEVTKLGGELQERLKEQYDSVARVATQLTAATHSLSEETKSIVQDVSSELHDVADINPQDLTRAQERPRTRGLMQSDLNRIPSSPGHGLRLLQEAALGSDYVSPRTVVSPSLKSRDIDAARYRSPLAAKGYSSHSAEIGPMSASADQDLLNRALANLGSSWRTMEKPTSRLRTAPTTSNYMASNSPGDKSKKQHGARGKHNEPHQLKSPEAVASVNKSRGARDYDKPWLSGIRNEKRDTDTMSQLYQRLRESHKVPRHNTEPRATSAQQKSNSAKRVWK